MSAARARLDRELLGYNRHAILVERCRVTVDRYLRPRVAFEMDTADRTSLREAREAANGHRDAIRGAVGDLVRLMRDAGTAPEIVIIAVKKRLKIAITAATPGAPYAEAARLETDATLWVIKAYYEAA